MKSLPNLLLLFLLSLYCTFLFWGFLLELPDFQKQQWEWIWWADWWFAHTTRFYPRQHIYPEQSYGSCWWVYWLIICFKGQSIFAGKGTFQLSASVFIVSIQVLFAINIKSNSTVYIKRLTNSYRMCVPVAVCASLTLACDLCTPCWQWRLWLVIHLYSVMCLIQWSHTNVLFTISCKRYIWLYWLQHKTINKTKWIIAFCLRYTSLQLLPSTSRGDNHDVTNV